ncbi:PH domain-containing protein [Streptomyces sp. S.PNR 29]|uniref:PH domain-containing protein n=1 Tax=Streptomyces sp. S.PNR 29 TaxID=2973805 RepID=UPI0025B066C3|nr:PH domain-containing protein [Streptomyces sp. S.PNR 29]MDN0195365.1 PH domain-containing protein [Streptomyces sp. S.PNR 29]
MTTPEHQSPAPQPPEPESEDRVHRSSAGIAGGVLLLAIIGWLGIDAVISGRGRTPWLALATLLLVVPLVVAFTLRPAVFAGDDRLRVRNPFRVIVLPWGQIAALRSGYSNEVLAQSGKKYQLWAIPVSLRARKKAARREARAAAEGVSGGAGAGGPGSRAGGLGLGGGAARRGSVTDGPVRAETDQIMDDLRQLLEARGTAEAAQGEVSVRWAYEVVGPAVAGLVLLVILLTVG